MPAERVNVPPDPSSLFDVDAVEGVAAERTELEVNHFLADWLELHRMRDGEPGRLLLEQNLRLFIQVRALRLIADRFGFGHEIIKRLITEFRDVRAACPLRGIATQQCMEEVVRIAVVAGPAELGHL